jgi:hypothetical protein
VRDLQIVDKERIGGLARDVENSTVLLSVLSIIFMSGRWTGDQGSKRRKSS